MAKPVRDLFKSGLNRCLAAKLLRLPNYKARDLADAIGVGEAVVSSWRSGRQTPTLENLGRIADELEVPVSELLRDDTVELAADNAVEEYFKYISKYPGLKKNGRDA